MVDANSVLVQTSHSIVSAGTERMVVELAKKSLLKKAMARPDLARKVIQKMRSEGFRAALEKTFAKLDTPVALGYSAAGRVVEAGRNVYEFKPGDRVACGGAGYAGHAEYLAVPRNLCVKIPDGVSYEDASFATLGAIALQGVRQADLRLGERVAVVGLGLLGLITVQLLKASGCMVLGIDPNPDRCQLAKELGADMAASSGAVDAAMALSGSYGLDAVLLTAATSSNQPIEEAADMLRLKGKVVVVGVVGLNIPRDAFFKKELELKLSMSYGPGRYDPDYEERGRDYPYAHVRWTEQRNMQCFVEQVAAGRLTPGKLITHRFDIDKGLEAYALMEQKEIPYLGISLKYPLQEAVPAAPVRRVEIKRAATSGGIGVGLLGAGNYAKSVLLPALKKIPGVSLQGVCTVKGMSSTETAKKAGFVYATTDPDQVINDPNVHTVLISTRHDTHADYTIQALQANKHVLVEKPLAITQEQLDRIKQALETLPAQRPILSVGFNRVFSKHTAAVLKHFANRSCPLTIQYRINAGTIPTESWIQDPEEGGGRILGEVCHFVNWCEHVVGATITSIQASSAGSTTRQEQADDTATIQMHFSDGSIASLLYLSSGSNGVAKERIEVHAAKKSAIIDDFASTTLFGGKTTSIRGQQDKGVPHMLHEFFAGIAHGRPPLPEPLVLSSTQATLDILRQLRTAN